MACHHCPKCKYTTPHASHMDAHRRGTGHGHGRTQHQYETKQVGNKTIQVRVKRGRGK